MYENVKLIEEISFNGHPALKTVYYDGWYLFFSKGYTNRANSVNMLQPSMLPIEEKIRYCEQLYTSQNLPTVFKITPLSTELDPLLKELGYSLVTKTNIMIMDLKKYEKSDYSVSLKTKIDLEWQDGEKNIYGFDDKTKEVSRMIQSNILEQTITATITYDNKIVASGLCVISNGYAGLYDIIVVSNYRRKGFGYALCSSLLEKARTMGAKNAYLQVVADNESAVKLYKKLGYVDTYQYWYRVKDMSIKK